MASTNIPPHPQITLIVLGYLVVAQAENLPDGFSVVGYVLGFLLLVLIPLLALGDGDSAPTASRAK
ncbi:hypothetical protein ACFFQF_00675 [Haladaptatus pallidirubidus]|uniref:hypothetical protein n=1 Tax=Haladaptatus pallidirubidus TaxID=1008152 RepID=UPI001D0FEA7F|nr:hypothetical protein [Haladaptatus pallidirubidus]